MQDPNLVNRPRDPVNQPIDPLTGAPAERQTIINNGSGRSSGTGEFRSTKRSDVGYGNGGFGGGRY